MIVRRLNLEEDWNLSVDVAPAIASMNPIYEAAQMTLIQPHALAIAMKKLSEERALEIEARVFASSVIMGSPTPGPDHWTEQEWVDWLLREPDAFDAIRSICESKINFDPENEVSGNGLSQDTRSETGPDL